MVAQARYRPVHDNVYMPVYRAIEETGHAARLPRRCTTSERIFEGMNRFISVHALASSSTTWST